MTREQARELVNKVADYDNGVYYMAFKDRELRFEKAGCWYLVKQGKRVILYTDFKMLYWNACSLYGDLLYIRGEYENCCL